MLETINELQSPYDVLRYLRQRTRAVEFTHFTVLKVPPLGMGRIAEISLLSSWPAELFQAYDAAELGLASPVLRRLARSALFFQFDHTTINSNREDGRQDEAVALFTRYGMERGAYFPVHDPAFGSGAIGFSGNRDALSASEMASLQILSIHVFDRLVQLQAAAAGDRPKLSVRERECLLWTAEGKTSFEIGKIIGISEHTVNYYLTTASGKLNSTNRVQAVAVALRSGLLG
ncbi:helix-turn-helix transcriptional regulator [Pararhizobium haloflavum]|uniref:helix-turn-helix transcriptional regulator n=1 Tax=Pararhizobium haloflavum TaxID=2037914 RepID=UPI0018E46760|nr:autoinducer binding domain-containing protein [Pararhizobium haloflavum]